MRWREFLEKSVPALMDQEVEICYITPDGDHFKLPVSRISFAEGMVTIEAEE